MLLACLPADQIHEGIPLRKVLPRTGIHTPEPLRRSDLPPQTPKVSPPTSVDYTFFLGFYSRELVGVSAKTSCRQEPSTPKNACKQERIVRFRSSAQLFLHTPRALPTSL